MFFEAWPRVRGACCGVCDVRCWVVSLCLCGARACLLCLFSFLFWSCRRLSVGLSVLCCLNLVKLHSSDLSYLSSSLGLSLPLLGPCWCVVALVPFLFCYRLLLFFLTACSVLMLTWLTSFAVMLFCGFLCYFLFLFLILLGSLLC